jgi:hypothetical protein
MSWAGEPTPWHAAARVICVVGLGACSLAALLIFLRILWLCFTEGRWR